MRKWYPTRIVGERTEGWRHSSESEDKVAEIKRSPPAPDCKEPPQHCSRLAWDRLHEPQAVTALCYSQIWCSISNTINYSTQINIMLTAHWKPWKTHRWDSLPSLNLNYKAVFWCLRVSGKPPWSTWPLHRLRTAGTHFSPLPPHTGCV